MEPIIVTAFWDVGRSSDCAIPRSNERYYEEFTAWARIRNKMIVYTDLKSYERIKQIRDMYGLLERTKIIVSDNIFEVESELYRWMKRVEREGKYKKFKYVENTMSNRADFDYAWMMKYWCLADACQFVDEEKILVWMDFGFNHLNCCFTDMTEFDFLWEINVRISKIQLFSLVPLDDISVIDVFQFQYDTIMGVFHIVPASLAEEFWSLVKQAMEALLMLECLDDDQMLLLMAYKEKPDIFDIHVSTWFLPIKEFGGKHLTTRKIEKTDTQGLWKERNEDFIMRCKERVTRYYS